MSFLILSITLIVAVLLVVGSLRNGISPTPSSRKQIREILRAIPPQFQGRIYDLGSGWGTLAMAIGKQRPNCEVIGIENSPVPYIISELILFFARRKNVKVIFANLLRKDLREADLIVCYLFPGGMKKLKPKLEEVKVGTLVISNTFAIADWKPAEILHANDVYHSPIYVYRTPGVSPPYEGGE